MALAQEPADLWSIAAREARCGRRFRDIGDETGAVSRDEIDVPIEGDAEAGIGLLPCRGAMRIEDLEIEAPRKLAEDRGIVLIGWLATTAKRMASPREPVEDRRIAGGDRIRIVARDERPVDPAERLRAERDPRSAAPKGIDDGGELLRRREAEDARASATPQDIIGAARPMEEGEDRGPREQRGCPWTSNT